MPTCDGCGKYWEDGISWSRHKGRCRLRRARKDESIEEYRQGLLRLQGQTDMQSASSSSMIPTQSTSNSLTHSEERPGGPLLVPQLACDTKNPLPLSPSRPSAAGDDSFDQFAANYFSQLDAWADSDLPVIAWPEPDLQGVPSSPIQPGERTQEEPYTTLPDRYGLYRTYPTGRPSYIPGDFILSDSHTIHSANDISFTNPYSRSHDTIDYSTAPITQSTHMLLNHWWSPGSNKKTIRDGDRLVNDVLLHPDFKIEELQSWKGIARETELLDSWLQDLNLHLPVKDKWIKAAIDLPVPSTKSHTTSEKDAPKFRLENIHVRRPLDVIQNALSEPGAERLHLFPYEEYWKSPSSNDDTPPVRTYGELYTSDAFLAEHQAIQQRVKASGRLIETVVIGLMFWSDSTHLSSFGTASLWPVYMYIGNQSKYIRSKPSSFSAHHVAYIPKSTISKELGDSGLNVYDILVPDVLHEVELGVWKGVFTHLIRVLHSRGLRYVNLLNERYRETPTFGRDTIRRFVNNVADMKKLGGRDFEDLLQCSIPAFQNLFLPKHNLLIQRLLFEMCTWHALAKLRKHTQYSLGELDASTTRLGTLLRKFAKDTQDDYDTKDLPGEVAKKARAQAAKAARKAAGTTTRGGESSTAGEPQPAKKRHLSLLTAKIHALGHVVEAIVAYGTTDSYNTMLGESEHRHSKGLADRAQKGGPEIYTQGIAKLERRERAILQTDPIIAKRRQAQEDGTLPFEYSERLPSADSVDHHQMSHEASSKNSLDLTRWLAENRGDPALKDFNLKLRRHLYCRLQGLDYTDDEQEITLSQLSNVIILNDTVYRHKFVRVNYTTYDQRREQDSINARTHPDIMMLSHDDKANIHPYWYARVRGIFHVRVYMNDPTSMAPTRPQDVEVVWIRWLGVHYAHRHGWQAKHLPKVGFVEPSDGGSAVFDFVDPTDIIRAVHLIPDFESQQGTNGLGPTIARPQSDNNLDWNYFYVNIFVDRDMFMRYRGGGIGHVDTRAAVDVWLKDRDKLDVERAEAELKRYLADDDEEMESSEGAEEEEEGEPMQVDDDEESVRSEEAGEVLSEALAEGLLLEEALDFGFDFGGEQSDDDDGEPGIGDLEDNWGAEDGENGMGEMEKLHLADL
ncbi:hypothetical protein MD484_g6527, partial [Candolleomyces efflorescens]